MRLREQLDESISAGIAGLWVRSNEHEDAIRDIASLCENRSPKWLLFVWDNENGLHNIQVRPDKPDMATLEPIAALTAFRALLVPQDDSAPRRPRVVLIMRDLHLSLCVERRIINPLLLQVLRDALRVGTAQGGHIVSLTTPGIGIPLELEKIFLPVDHALPDATERWQIINQIEEDPARLPVENSPEARRLTDVSAGLTRLEIVGAFSRSISRHGEIRGDTIMELKREILRQTGLLTVAQPTAGFDKIGGLNHIKQFCLRGINSPNKDRACSRGVLAVGVPGCLHADTPIYDPVDKSTRTVLERHNRGVSFHVISRDDAGQAVIGEAQPPSRFPAAEQVKVTLADGRTFTVTKGHRVFNGDDYVPIQHVCAALLQSGVYRLPSISDSDLSMFQRDGQHLTRTAANSANGYFACSSCDARPLFWPDNVQDASPLPSGVPQHSPLSCDGDDLASAAPRSLFASPGRFSMPDLLRLRQKHNSDGSVFPPALTQHESDSDWSSSVLPPDVDAGRSDTVLQPVEYVPASMRGRHQATNPGRAEVELLPSRDKHRNEQRSAQLFVRRGEAEEKQQVRSTESFLRASGSYVRDTNDNNSFVTVVKIEPAPTDVYYDFHVPNYNNYWACGCWHHNTAKTVFARALGFETGLPVLELNAGNLMGGIVGQTESRTKQAFEMIDAQAPCILFMDELEKMLAGAGGGARDSGVSDRLFGAFLSWLSDHTSEVFTLATCNSVSNLSQSSSGAFTRSGRFDALFFMDIPNKEQKELIWQIWLKHYQLDPEQPRPDDKQWTGADIEQTCRLAVNQDVPLTDIHTVPLMVSSPEQIEALRDFANHRYLSADYVGVYDKDGDPKRKIMTANEIETARPRRRITRSGIAV